MVSCKQGDGMNAVEIRKLKVSISDRLGSLWMGQEAAHIWLERCR